MSKNIGKKGQTTWPMKALLKWILYIAVAAIIIYFVFFVIGPILFSKLNLIK